MGIVYEAEDTRLRRVVALKVLPPGTAQDRDARMRFLHEARAASALDHPNICPVFDADETPDGHMFLVMPRYEGETLHDVIARGPLPLDAALKLALQIANALSAAHERGIVHRDVKPANVFVTRDGVVKVLDFGLAKLSEATEITETGTTLGTVAYMSPEQARGSPVDRRADVWALGIVLYEMTTATKPFPGEHPQAVIRAILEDEPEPLSHVSGSIPRELERIVAKALTKDPERRYSRVEDMMLELRKLQRVTDSGMETAVSGPAPRGGFSKWLYPGVALLTAALAAAVLWRFEPGGDVNGVPEIDSIAVLPMTNLMQNPEQDYFVDGLQEALITSLSKVRALRVISRTSTMRYEDPQQSIPDIARELDVDAIVEGSVLRVDDRVRITTQLVHGPTDAHLWARSYDRDLENVLVLMSEVAQEIADEIEIVLTPEETELLRSKLSSVSIEAQDAYLRGRYELRKIDGEALRNSIEHFERAISIEPSFAAAHGGEAQAYFMLGLFGEEPWGEIVPRARAAAESALELDDGNADAHTAMGWIRLYFDWDWTGAEREFLRALEINASDAMARHAYGDYLTVTGRAEEGARQVLLGRQADPFSRATVAPVPSHLFFARRYDEASEECDRLMREHPELERSARRLRADILWQQGMQEEALQLYRKLWETERELVAALDEGLARGGPLRAMREAAEVLRARSTTTRVSPQRIAELYGRAREQARALEWLERALSERRPATLHVFAMPVFDFLRSTEEFQRLRRRIGLP